ncbi:MAG TPA: sodium-dependent transporter [Candidatus Krumholzibacteria bacterium]|nr:sodium-dependent transporter [Candidatus Krumholzibacteria bacterium]
MAKAKQNTAHAHGHNEEWGTRLGVILAVAGSAVGLGNFLRFPGQAAQNGGGAFMIPYICALLFLGIPIGWAEWTMGRYGGRKGFHSAPSILGVFGKGPTARYLGILGILIPLAVSFYYTYIEAWCLGYFWHYLTGGIGIDPSAAIEAQTSAASQFYGDFIGTARNGVITGHGMQTFVFWVITFTINIWLVYRGISKGIEKFVSFAMPVMALCAFIVLGRVLTLGTPDPAHPDQNVINGLAFMWNPRFDALSNPQTWLAAAGQIFFSLSVGFGVIINYASYLKKKDDVVLSGLTASATNEFFEVGFGGLITLTAAFIFLGTTNMIGAVQGGTFGLGFTTLPVVFAHMGKAGNMIGATWFLMLFIAAITSSISMYQPSLAFFRESLGWDKRKSTTLMVAICVFGSFLVMYFSKGSVFLGTIDNWVGTFMIFILAMVQIICFSWVFGIERGWKEAHVGSHMKIPWFYKFIMKWVTPVYLIVVFAAFCWQNLGSWIQAVVDDPLQQGALALIVITLFVLIVCTVVGERRWRAAGLDVDGRGDAEDERRSA